MLLFSNNLDTELLISRKPQYWLFPAKSQPKVLHTSRHFEMRKVSLCSLLASALWWSKVSEWAKYFDSSPIIYWNLTMIQSLFFLSNFFETPSVSKNDSPKLSEKTLLKTNPVDFLLNRRSTIEEKNQLTIQSFRRLNHKLETQTFLKIVSCYWFASILKTLYLRIYGFDFIHHGLNRKAHTSRGRFECIISPKTTSNKNLTNPKFQNLRLKLGPVDCPINRNAGTRRHWTYWFSICLMLASKFW